MKKLKYLLVCEGPTDIALLKKLTKKLSNDLNADIEIAELAPQVDATTGLWPAHGWGAVRSWCYSWKVKTEEELSNAPPFMIDLLKRRTWKALIAFNNADGLIIQMDTDIAECITDLSTPFDPINDNRRDYCRDAILYWLSESNQSNDKPFILLPSYALESWLLATHSPENTIFNDLPKPLDYEKITDLESRLISLGYAKKRNKGRDRLVKTYAVYNTYADIIHTNFENVSQRCSEAKAYLDFITEKSNDN